MIMTSKVPFKAYVAIGYLFASTYLFVEAVPSPLYHTRAVTNSSKAGLAWPNANSVNIGQYAATGKVSWYYTWSAYPTKSDLEFSPMLWGPRSLDQFTATIRDTLLHREPKITAVLGMNEPEQKGQSNMTAQEGAQLWQTYIEPLRSMGVRLGSPAPSSAPSGKVWLQDFFTACNGNCTVDFIAMHWYGTDASAFISYLHDYHGTFQKPLWVTEWACQNFVDFDKQCSADDVVKFLNATQSFMDSADFVERYSWFGAMKEMQGVNPADALMDKNGKINALGRQYIGSQGAQFHSGSSMSVNGRLSLSPYSLLIPVGMFIGIHMLSMF